jgi:hypothetical protein
VEEGVASIIPFIARGVFDETATRIIDEAFDAARKEMHDDGRSALVYEVMAHRIRTAARNGERDVTRLKDIALAGIARSSKNDGR